MKKLLNHRASRWVSLVCFSVAAFWTYKVVRVFCQQQTDGFTIQAISSNRPSNPAWDVHFLSDGEKAEIEQALSQRYHYLACGNQAFAFLSEDGRYVIKFFKQKLFEPSFFLKWSPAIWMNPSRREKKLWKKQDKLQRDFASYRLSFDELKEETGLVYVHLNPSDWIRRNLIICDKLNIAHAIPLDRFNFILQKRADLVFPTIDKLMAEGNLAGAKRALSSILELFVSRCQKGILDSDPDLDKNFGFIDGHAVQIDIGRFTRQPIKVKFAHCNQDRPASLSSMTPPVIKETFKTWLTENYPSLFDHFMSEYDVLCQSNQFSSSASISLESR